jgi:chromosome segregation ATPase
MEPSADTDSEYRQREDYREPMTEHAAERPRFAIVMRGYDRDQVDAYLAEYERWASDAQSHIEAGEARLTAGARRVQSLEAKVADLEERSGDTLPPSVRSLGERAEQILRDAWEAAQELRSNIMSEADAEKEKARQASEDVVAAAEKQAAEVAEHARNQRDEAAQEVEEARRRVERLIKEAEEEAEAKARAIWDEAQVQLKEARKELTRLEDQRRATLDELTRLRELLESVIGNNGPHGGREPAPVPSKAERTAEVLTADTASIEGDPAADDTREASTTARTQQTRRLADGTGDKHVPRPPAASSSRKAASKGA